jgi:hypothetical protein
MLNVISISHTHDMALPIFFLSAGKNGMLVFFILHGTRLMIVAYILQMCLFLPLRH